MKKLNDIINTDKLNYMNTFGARTPVCFEYGEGIFLYDTNGKKYTDLFAGIAVNALGHGHPDLVGAITEQAKKLIHCSNLYYNEPQTKLAEKLNQLAGGGFKVFFANSGAEANEAAIKLARAFFNKQGLSLKNEFVTLNNSFHGRTLTTITATAQPKYQKYFTPLTPGFSYVAPNDFAALEEAVGENTCGIILEIIQGESGVHPMDLEYLKKVRKLCDDKNVLMIVDEVQTGIGRTGHMFAYQGTGIEPDIFTLAKALGGGVPIGAACAKAHVADAFAPGDHGTTFGGNPLACAAALVVLKVIEDDDLLKRVERSGTHFSNALEALKKKGAFRISEIRANGLMIGIDFAVPVAAEIKKNLFEAGFLVGNVGEYTLRLLPPLIIGTQDIDAFITALKGICEYIGGMGL